MHPVEHSVRAGLRALGEAVLAAVASNLRRPAADCAAAARTAAGLWQLSEADVGSAPSEHRAPSPAMGEVPAAVGSDPDTERVSALVDLARAGDAEAFGALYDHYVGTIYRFTYYRTGVHSLAEDLTSETFFRALRSVGSFRWQGKDFGAWLVTIARNLVADHFKSSRFRLEVSTDEILRHDTTTDGVEDEVVAGMTNELLLEGIRRLPGEQQECVVLRFLEGMSLAETATALDRSVGAVKQLQLRAVRSLAKALPEDLR